LQMPRHTAAMSLLRVTGFGRRFAPQAFATGGKSPAGTRPRGRPSVPAGCL
jgi:hypothetical protein